MSLMTMILAFAPTLAARLGPHRSELELEAEVPRPQLVPGGLKGELEAMRRERDALRAPQPQLEQQMHQDAALPTCVPGRHAILARRGFGSLSQFLGPGFPARI
jgi:hypothetical protein